MSHTRCCMSHGLVIAATSQAVIIMLLLKNKIVMQLLLLLLLTAVRLTLANVIVALFIMKTDH